MLKTRFVREEYRRVNDERQGKRKKDICDIFYPSDSFSWISVLTFPRFTTCLKFLARLIDGYSGDRGIDLKTQIIALR
ncbi:MAG: hypothetical protein GTO24_07780 [candidate division Zixibacteria bacterium]|nr:hypothetical protein [candidate division Zixibacteria bacterium]